MEIWPIDFKQKKESNSKSATLVFFFFWLTTLTVCFFLPWSYNLKCLEKYLFNNYFKIMLNTLHKEHFFLDSDSLRDRMNSIIKSSWLVQVSWFNHNSMPFISEFFFVIFLQGAHKNSHTRANKIGDPYLIDHTNK